MSEVSQTLYVNRICEKVGVYELKRSLFSLFSRYGTIIDICAHKGIKKRGQAFITFADIESAVRAKNALDNYFLFDRQIRVNFAKTKSLAARRLAGMNPYGRKAKSLTRCEAIPLASGAIPRHFDFEMESESDDAVQPVEVTVKPEAAAPVNELIPPNKILFVQHIPTNTDAKLLLDMLFGQYRGYVECRPVPMKPDIAFVEFENADQATVALAALNGLEVDDGARMLIQYAKN